jgi:hypothetical protein
MDQNDRERRARQIAGDIAAVGARFVATVGDLAVLARDLAHLSAERRAVDGRMGIFDRPRPEELELATRVLLSQLAPLRPHLQQFESTASGIAAAAALCDRQPGDATAP